MFCISVRNKQQVYYSCAIVLLLRHIYWKYDLFIAKYIDINAIISLYFSYNTSINSGREFKPLQLSAFDFSFSSPLILSGWYSTGFNALVIHHLKHSLSTFFKLIIAFLLSNSVGNLMYELPFNGLYTTVLISNLTT